MRSAIGVTKVTSGLFNLAEKIVCKDASPGGPAEQHARAKQMQMNMETPFCPALFRLQFHHGPVSQRRRCLRRWQICPRCGIQASDNCLIAGLDVVDSRNVFCEESQVRESMPAD